MLVSKFLLLAALVTLFTNWVNTNGENLLFRVIQETLAVQAQDQGIAEGRAMLDVCPRRHHGLSTVTFISG